MKWFVKALNQYADFKGRAGREEFWMFVLFNFFVTFAITGIGIGISIWTGKTGVVALPLIYMMAVLIPSWAAVFRRLHDTGRSAWFLLACLIPVVGWIWLLVVLTYKGIKEDNLYGKNPAETPSSHYYRRRSAAVALILSSVFWLFSLLALFFISSDWNERQLLTILLPFGLLITSAMFFFNRVFSTGLASALIISSSVWLFRDVLVIREIYSHLFEHYNILLLISQFSFFVPVSLFLTGIYILIKKADRTFPACLLFAGAISWILSFIFDIVNIDLLLNDISVFLSLLITTMVITVPVSLLVFARTLLSKEKVFKSEPVVGDNRKEVVFLREDKDNDNLWVVYKASSKTDAMAFLSNLTVDRSSYFVVVETPEGNFGRDINGIYQE